MSISSQIILKLRQDRGWSQEKLAAISGISERTIQRIESDGSCSLDTKLALASAFEVSPTVLNDLPDQKDSSELKTDWSGAVGLFVLGLVCPLIIIVTGVGGLWEVASVSIVAGLAIVLSIISHGGKATYSLFNNTSWIVRYPVYVTGLNRLIIQSKTFIENVYIVGIVASLVSALSLSVHSDIPQDNLPQFVAIVARPLVYAVVLSECWFRPYKHKMERMLIAQREMS